MSENPPIELPHLMPVLEALPNEEASEFLDDLFVTFNAQIEPRLPELNRAVEQHQPEPLRKVVHFIAGSASNMGMTRLAALCRNTEQAIKANAFDEYETFARQFDAELAQGRKAFEKLLASYSS